MPPAGSSRPAPDDPDPRLLDGRILIRTDRLVLRNWCPADVAPYARISADPVVMAYLGGPRSPDLTREIIEASARDMISDGYAKIAVERRADGAFLGMCGLSHEQWYPDEVEIGWRIDPAHQRQGYATEAATAWRDHAFAVLGLPRLISIIDVPNAASIRVAAKIGMTRDHLATLDDDGTPFDAVIYSLSAPAPAA